MPRIHHVTFRCAARSTRARLPALVATLVAAGTGFGIVAASRPAAAAPYPQWGLAQIDAPAAWPSGTGAGVRIGIVDTGVDWAHTDLAGKVLGGATFLSQPGSGCATAASDPGGQDDEGHGTHVAGIAAGAGGNIAGAAPGASLLVAKVLDCTGSGVVSDINAGIQWVVDHGARVVNLSLGTNPGLLGLGGIFGCGSASLATGVEYAWNHGAIPVLAAGNNAGALFCSSSGYGNLDAVVVAATGPSGAAASYTSTPGNAKWGVLAPGGDGAANAPSCAQSAWDGNEILSTYLDTSNPQDHSCYATDEGTSMATPFVSGTLALLLGRGLNQSRAVEVLLATLDHSANCGSGGGCQGLVDAGAAMAAADRILPPPPAAAAAAVITPPTSAPRHVSGVPTAAGGSTIGAVGTTAPSTASAPAPSTTAPSRHLRAAPLHDHGPGGGGWWLALVLVAGAVAVAAASAQARRRVTLTRSRAATMPEGSGPGADPAAGQNT